MENTPSEKHYTIREIVEKNLIGFKRRSIQSLIQHGKLGAIRLGRRLLVVPESEIKNYLASRPAARSKK